MLEHQASPHTYPVEIWQRRPIGKGRRIRRLMTVLGSRLLETRKRMSESAEALALRQAGESSIIGSLAVAVTASLNEVLRWVNMSGLPSTQ